jgi:adenylate cyclase
MAQSTQDSALLLEGHRALGSTLLWQGEFSRARVHLEQGHAFYDPQQHRGLAFLHGGADPGVSCLCDVARALWFLGYPEQALQRSHEALALARELSDPFSVGFALVFAAGLHQLRREARATQEQAEAGIALASEQGFAPLVSAGTIRRGWALAEQGRAEEGLVQMQQGLTSRRTAGAGLAQPYFLALQAEVYGKVGQPERALPLLDEALAAVSATGEYRLEAEVYRLKGQLTLQQSKVQSPKSKVEESSESGVRSLRSKIKKKIKNQKSKGKGQKKLSVLSSQLSVPSTQHLTPSTQEAEACFQKAIEITRKRRQRGQKGAGRKAPSRRE